MPRNDIIFQNTERTCTITCREEFLYKPYTPKKRSTLKKTNKALFIQKSEPFFLYGDNVAFTAKVSKQNADCIYLMYSDNLPIEFTGQYGEQYTIELIEPPEIMYKYSYAEITGQLTIMCIETDVQPQCPVQ